MRDIAKDIIDKAACGDLDAFEMIYKEYSASVYTIALGITRNRQDAEEVTQDVFVKIFRKLKGFAFRSSFGTWVYRITANTAVNTYNSRTRRGSNTVRIEEMDDLPDRSSTGPDAPIVQKEEGSKLALVLDALSPEHRSCIVLREIEGLNYKEMAGVLRIPVNTVRSRLRRAREALVAALRREGIRHGL